ncbi:MAG: sulfotransferase family protein [Egibacteraceae bacterium]
MSLDGAVLQPLFILAPPRSFTSVVSSMLGQHPQMYAPPEINLLITESMREWWHLYSEELWMTSGPLRTIAELYFGGQSEETVRLAEGWVRARLDCTTSYVFEELVERVHPLILVDKSTQIVHRCEDLKRALHISSRSSFLHLLRDPHDQALSALNLIDMKGPIPPDQRAMLIAAAERGEIWYRAHRNICAFLDSIPADQKLRIRGEDLLADSGQHLRQIARWLGVRDDDDAIEEMRHPERSPFAFIGPPNAPFGNDLLFLENPALRVGETRRRRNHAETGIDGQLRLPEEVCRLAEELGYQ